MIIESINHISDISEETSVGAENASSIAINNLDNATKASEYIRELVTLSNSMKKFL